MIAEKREKIHLMVRPNFENDLIRHFVGKLRTLPKNNLRIIGYYVYI